MKKFQVLFWLFILAALAIVLHPYFQIGLPDTHDGNNHLVRFASYKIAVKEGQFPPRWAPNLQDLYGYPVFNFNYPLANILSLPFSILKVHYELIFKLIVAGSLVSGLVGLKKWLEQIYPRGSGLFPALLSWLFLPYLISAIYFRGNIGEIIAYGLLPVMLYIVESVRLSLVSNKQIISNTLLMAAFFLSHNVTVVFFMPILLLYALARYQGNWQAWNRFILVGGLAIVLSLWFWLPAISEMHYTNITRTGLTNEYDQHFATVQQLLLAPLSFGYSVPGRVDGLSFNLGIVTIIVGLISSLVVVIKLAKNTYLTTHDWLLGLSGVIILLLSFLQTNYSSVAWSLFSFTDVIQFPWRLSMYLGVFVALGVYLLWQENIWIIRWILAGSIIWAIQTTWNTNEIALLHRPRAEYDTQTITTDILAENRPTLFRYEMNQPWQPMAQTVAGQAKISPIDWTGSRRTYTVNVLSTAVVVEPTANFPGWQTAALKNGERSVLNYMDNEIIKGRIAYELEPGSYTVTTMFTQNTWPRLLGNTFSVIGIIILGCIFFNKRKAC